MGNADPDDTCAEYDDVSLGRHRMEARMEVKKRQVAEVNMERKAGIARYLFSALRLRSAAP
jgi:hypothetical protein